VALKSIGNDASIRWVCADGVLVRRPSLSLASLKANNPSQRTDRLEPSIEHEGLFSLRNLRDSIILRQLRLHSLGCRGMVNGAESE
jgi:hypothetical protein